MSEKNPLESNPRELKGQDLLDYYKAKQEKDKEEFLSTVEEDTSNKVEEPNESSLN